MKYFYKGKIVQIVSDIDLFNVSELHDTCVIEDVSTITGEPCYKYQTLVPFSLLEPIVKETYPIGTFIQIKNSQYTGVVIGYEDVTNSVITAPTGKCAASMQHVRYSHRAPLVEVLNTVHVHLKPGKYYIINNAIKCLAVRVPDNKCMLVTNRGEIAYDKVPAVATSSELLAVGIQIIEETRRK